MDLRTKTKRAIFILHINIFNQSTKLIQSSLLWHNIDQQEADVLHLFWDPSLVNDTTVVDSVNQSSASSLS